MNPWEEVLERDMGEHPDLQSLVDPFEDDEEMVTTCDLENPESCESCQ